LIQIKTRHAAGEERLFLDPLPGRSAARSGALQNRDRRMLGAQRRICGDPGSAVHHHSASKTRVNALLVLHRIRGTAPLLPERNLAQE